ncbi:MAG: hypothetical protein CMD65_00585 [Gammaproteobacteria bacterium]|nr:hypothetical protein [Gammaproteobacteria bacterium]|tara:strand:- start:2017 stop:2778 length:762 start_codon:yes stop_codon:yes gene_type:complete
MSKFIIKQAYAEAIDLQQRNQFDEAKQIYKKILSIDDTEANAHHLLSLIYLVEKDHKLAKEHIEKAVDIAPNVAIFQSNYGGLLYSIGETQKAIKALKASVKLDKKLLQSYYSLGVIYSDINEHEKAIKSYNSALDINNDSVETHNNLANIYSAISENEKARTHFKKTIDLAPTEVYPRFNMSIFLIKAGDFKEAISILNELVQNNTATKEVFNNLGIAYKGLEDNENAKKMFEEALKIDDKFDLARKNIENL